MQGQSKSNRELSLIASDAIAYQAQKVAITQSFAKSQKTVIRLWNALARQAIKAWFASIRQQPFRFTLELQDKDRLHKWQRLRNALTSPSLLTSTLNYLGIKEDAKK